MECRLEHSSSSWRCQISIRRTSFADFAPQTARSNQGNEIPFGKLITEKSELEEMIRRAQLAVLNPDVPSVNFETLDTTQLVPGEVPPDCTCPLSFSSDVICLDIEGPDVTDLAFIDLPGACLLRDLQCVH